MTIFSLIVFAVVLMLLLLPWIRPRKGNMRTPWKTSDLKPKRMSGIPKYNYELGGDLGLLTNDRLPHQSTALDERLTPVEVKSTLLDKTELSQKTIPTAELPEGYNDHRIVALVRDPYWLFTYWELNDQKIQELRDNFGARVWEEAQHVLRIYDTTDVIFNGTNAHYHFDLLINSFASRWHVEVGQPNRTFCIERGLILANGQYLPLIRSNFVTTPSDRVSQQTDEQWLLWSKYDRQLFRYLEELPFGATSPQFAFQINLAEELARFGFGVSSPTSGARK